MDAFVYRMADGGYGATVHIKGDDYESMWAPTLNDLGDMLLECPGDMEVYTEDRALAEGLRETLDQRLHEARPAWAKDWEPGTYPYPDVR